MQAPRNASNPEASSAPDLALAEILEELANLLHSGDAPDISALAQKHPEHAGRIRQLAPVLQMVADLARRADRGSSAALVSGAAAPAAGVLGDYRIVREVGRGGMGIVYEAEQISLKRRVALKVLPFAALMDQRQLARFHNEARAAASLQHANIVAVYAVGCQQGVHYYAMQFVEGQSLDVIIDGLRLAERDWREAPSASAGDLQEAPSDKEQEEEGSLAVGLSPKGASLSAATLMRDALDERVAPRHEPRPDADDRDTDPFVTPSTTRSTRTPEHCRSVARLGVQAAEALDHAHNHGVIHRDIKPANLLLDHAGKLWITDFGVARVGEDTGMTITGGVVGTLRYMSPEQAEGARPVFDHRADIYSLGVTLYELLTLSPAVRGDNRQQMLREIADEDPRPPRKLNKAVAPGLEAVILKAIAKNPEQRYVTAQALADDLRRYLEDKPTQAKPRTLADRVGRWSRRHKPVVWSGLAVLWIALLSLSASTMLLARKQQQLTAERNRATEESRRAEQAEKAARKAQANAEQAAAKAEAVNQFLTEDLLWQADPSNNPAADQVKLLDVLNRAAEQVDKRFADQPQVKAAVHRTIGKTYFGLGRYVKGADHQRAALELLRKHQGGEDPATLDVMVDLGETLAELGQWDEEDQLLRECFQTSRRRLGMQSELVRKSLDNLVWLTRQRNDLAAAEEVEKLLREHVEAARRAFGPNDLRTAEGMNVLGASLRMRGKSPEAEPLLRQVVDIRRRAAPDAPETAGAVHNLAILLCDQRKYDQAEPLLRDSLNARRRLLGAQHPRTFEAQDNLGVVLLGLKRYDDAEKVLRQNLEDCRQSLSVEHAATFAAVDHLSRVLSVCNKLKDAQSLLEENVAALRKKFGNEHFNTVAAANMLANLLLHQGEYAKTEQLTSQNLAAAKRTLGPKHAETVYCLYLLLSSLNEQRKSGQEKNIGLAHVGMMSEAHHGDRDHAAGDHMSGLLLLGHSHTDPAPDDFVENVALGALERKRRAWPPEPPISVAGTLAVLGQVLVARDRAKDAEPLLRECLAIRKQALPAGHWLIAETEALLGDCLSRLGRHADAEPLLTNACPALAKAEQVLASRKVEAIDRIIAFYQRSNRPQHVLAWRGQLVSLLQDTLPNLQNARPPDDWSIAKAQNRLGACLAAMERHEEAEPILLESYATLTALSDDPQVDSGDTQRLKRDTLQQILQLRQHQGESEEATAWRTQVQVDSKPPSARTAQEAVKTWATLASHRPGKPQYQRMLAISWLSAARAARKKGQAKEALSSFAKAEEALLSLPEQSRERRWATEHLWRFASERADALAALGQHEESFVEYEKAIRMRPDRLDLLTTAAWAMANCPDPALRKPARAVELAEQAAKLDPQDPFASRVLGAAQYRAGDSKHAVETLTKAVDLQSAEDRATVCLFLAMAHWKLGDKEQARQWRDQAAQWTAKHKPSEELRRLRTEADELLGISSENKMEETAKKN